jgi:MlaC protein
MAPASMPNASARPRQPWAARSGRAAALVRWPEALLLGLLCTGSWGRAQTSPQVDEFLGLLNADIAIIASQSGGGVSSSCASVIAGLVDLDAIARDAAADLWARMTQSERDAYREQIGRRAVRECAHQHHDNTGAPMTLVGVRQGQGGDWLLATRSNHARGSHNVIWRLRGDGAQLRAVDVLFDGHSTTLTLRDETKMLFDRNSGNIDMMISALAPRR